jgi:biopolymer transport protein ExbB
MFLVAGLALAPAAAVVTYADGAAAPAPAPAAASSELDMGNYNAQQQEKKKANSGFLGVVTSSGLLGIILWLALGGDLVAAIYFIVDCFVLVKPQKIMPQTLIDAVQNAMNEGDVQKALEACENEPGSMANILSAAFSHVEEGFDVVQEAVNAAADLETERIMQRLTWISVCSNLGPMLGLLGTVQGMIDTFAKLSGGTPDVAELATSIGQALWTTAGGLVVAIPSMTFFYALRNNANRLILRMTAVTIDLVKGLRNVEMVSEEEAAMQA